MNEVTITVFGQSASFYSNDGIQEFSLPEWSGRRNRTEALEAIAQLRAFLDKCEHALTEDAIPPAPCPLPEPPLDPDDTKPIVIPPRPKRARRMAIHQRAYWQSWQEHYRNIEAVVEEGVSRGHFTKVTRPDGQIGIGLTDAGYEWLEERGL